MLVSSAIEPSDHFAERVIPLRVAGSRARARKWQAQPAFILNAIDYRDSSLIVRAYTRNQGLITLLAKGAKRHYSQLRGVLQLFQELHLSYSERQEIKVLTACEWHGSIPLMPVSRHFSAYYVNELMLLFNPPEEVNEAVFDAYQTVLTQLAEANSTAHLHGCLRHFEYKLLYASGLIDACTHCQSSGEAIQIDGAYQLDVQHGTRRVSADEAGSISGRGLQQLVTGDRDAYARLSESELQEMRNSLRRLIQYHLNGRVLKTRQVTLDLQT